MTLEALVIRAWIVVTAVWGVLGFVFGYWKISNDLDGAIYGYIVFMAVEVVLAPVFLGYVLAVI